MVLTVFILTQSILDDAKAVEIIPEKTDTEQSMYPFVCYQQLLHSPNESVKW